MLTKNKKSNIISYLIVGVFLVWILIPILLMFMQSVKPDNLMFSDPPSFIFKPTLDHFDKIISKNNMLSYMLNSMIVAFSTMALCVSMGSLCAYSLSKIKFKGYAIMAFLIILTRMVPVGALMMPMYVIMNKAGLTSSFLGVICAHTTLNLPFTVLLLQGFFKDVPAELEEAAEVDGCSKIGTFFKIALPLIAPGLATTGIMVLLNSWNEFMFALILTSRLTRTLPIGISSFMGSVSIDWGASSAAATLATIPVFIFGVCIQKYFIRGLTSGAVKG